MNIALQRKGDREAAMADGLRLREPWRNFVLAGRDLSVFRQQWKESGRGERGKKSKKGVRRRGSRDAGEDSSLALLEESRTRGWVQMILNCLVL